MSSSRFGLALLIVLMACARGAQAQGFGVTGGVHANPDQFYGGGLYEFAPLTDHVTLRPGGELGVGNGATLLAANVDFIYALTVWSRSPWRPYLGGGPSINHYRFALYSQTEPGATAVAGLRRAPWLTELRVGFFDSPTMTINVGYSLRKSPPRRPARPRRASR